MERLAAARRGETLFVVSPESAPVPLLERADDARRAGATILALNQGDPELDGLAHETLTVAPDATAPVTFAVAQHLVSAAAGEPAAARRGLRQRLAHLLDVVSGEG
jgi:DNA-binding MurR/RpiR family transcriptional regulator